MRHARTFGLLLGAFVLLGTAVGVAGSAAPSSSRKRALTPDSTFVADKSVSGAIAQTDPSLLGQDELDPINVMIKYDVDATASYAGGVAGYAATSPSRHGRGAQGQQERGAGL